MFNCGRDDNNELSLVVVVVVGLVFILYQRNEKGGVGFDQLHVSQWGGVALKAVGGWTFEWRCFGGVES